MHRIYSIVKRTMMKQLLVAIVTAPLFAVGISAVTPTFGAKLVTDKLTGSGSVRRELYEECKEGGKIVHIRPECCLDTMDVQAGSRHQPAWLNHNSHSHTNNHQDDFCKDEVNQADWLSHLDKYCYATISTTMGAVVECSYDYWKDNYACHKQASDTCRRLRGKTVHSNLTMVCGDNLIMTIRNHMDCLGYTCSKHDAREFVLTYIDSQNKRQSFRHTADGECRFTEINGVSIDTMKRQDATRNTVVIVSLLIVAVIVGYLRYYLMRDLPEPNSMVEIPRVHRRQMLRTPNAYTAVKATTPATEFEREFA